MFSHDDSDRPSWLQAGRSRRRHHDRPELPDGGGARGDNVGDEEGCRTEEGRGGKNKVERNLSASDIPGLFFLFCG